MKLLTEKKEKMKIELTDIELIDITNAIHHYLKCVLDKYKGTIHEHITVRVEKLLKELKEMI